MSGEQKKLLESQLWAIANILRGKISANQFQDYIQGFIFYKYISEKLEKKANKFLKPEVFFSIKLMKTALIEKLLLPRELLFVVISLNTKPTTQSRQGCYFGKDVL